MLCHVIYTVSCEQSYMPEFLFCEFGFIPYTCRQAEMNHAQVR